MRVKKVILGGILFVYMVVFTGCVLFEEKLNERSVDYTIITQNDVPEELKQQIESEKNGVMKITYKDDEFLYIVKGYGTQKYGGYSIKMKQLYVKDKAIYIDTQLVEPQEGEIVSKEKSEPYIIVKTEKCELPVVFK